MSKDFSRTEISELGEFGLIDHLLEPNVIKLDSTIKGPGDDAAVLWPKGRSVVVSTDLLMEGIHFDLTYTPLKHLGYKAVVINLSDIVAMNVIPTQITVSLAISNRFSVEAIDELYAGIYAACQYYNVDLVGGDTTSSHSGLAISITALGYATKDEIVGRDGAKTGDLICVTGDLGAAYLGLQLLEREKQLFMDDPNVQPDLEEQKYLVGRQLKPEARKDVLGMFRQSEFQPTSMIDVSDGLASELFHLSKQSKVGILLFEAQVPIHQEAKMMALKFNMDPITCALSGGEDYELLFTAAQEDLDKVRQMADVYIIGEVTPPDFGLKMQTEGKNIVEIVAQGWKHFEV